MSVIYKVTNLSNNRIYIGQTIQNVPWYKGSGKYLKLAHKKYGKNNFKFEKIVEGDFNKELTDSLEIHYIRLYNSTNKKIGYNLSQGGGGGWGRIVSKETRLKSSISQKGKVRTEEFKRKVSEYQKGNQWRLGTKQPKEFIEKHRLFMTGKTYAKGRKWTEEERRERNRTRKERYYFINEEIKELLIKKYTEDKISILALSKEFNINREAIYGIFKLKNIETSGPRKLTYLNKKQ